MRLVRELAASALVIVLASGSAEPSPLLTAARWTFPTPRRATDFLRESVALAKLTRALG